MLIDSPQVVENSSISNATIASGTVFPGNPTIGELFYMAGGGPPIGLYIYNGTDWEIVTLGGEDTETDPELVAHMADQDAHITSSQNQFLDGLTVAFGEVNTLAGLSSFLGSTPLATQLNTFNTSITNLGNSITNIINTKVSSDGTTPMTGNLDLGGFTLVNAAPPAQPGDLVTKAYVDSIVQDPWVRAMAGLSLI